MCDIGAATCGLDQDLGFCIALHVGELFCDSSETIGSHYERPKFVAFVVGKKKGGAERRSKMFGNPQSGNRFVADSQKNSRSDFMNARLGPFQVSEIVTKLEMMNETSRWMRNSKTR